MYAQDLFTYYNTFICKHCDNKHCTKLNDIIYRIPSITGYNLRKKRQVSLEDNFFDDDLISRVNKSLFEPAVHADTNLYCNILNSLPMVCVMFSIVDIWNFNSARIQKDSQEEIIEKINTVKNSPTLGHPINFSKLLGGITRDERGRIIAATAVKTDIMVHVNFLKVNMDETGNNAGTADWVR